MRLLLVFVGLSLVINHMVNGFLPQRFHRFTRGLSTQIQAAQLLPDPLPYAIGKNSFYYYYYFLLTYLFLSLGNFFDNSTGESMSFIQCYMVSLGSIDANQYGVGVPVDTPVMLTYFEGNELKPVKPDYPDYDHLVNHVAVQMDTNEFQLYRTPVVLTLQGDLDDDEEENDDGEEEMEGDDDEEEYTLDELLAMEDDDEEEFDEDEEVEEDDEEDEDDEDEDNDDDDNNGNMSSFWASSPSGKIDEKYNKIPDISLFRSPTSDTAPSTIPADALVTEEDTKALKKAHRKADRVIQYAADLTLIASFHYKKKNYHLVRLLEPILIIGKRVTDIKGYIHTL